MENNELPGPFPLSSSGSFHPAIALTQLTLTAASQHEEKRIDR